MKLLALPILLAWHASAWCALTPFQERCQAALPQAVNVVVNKQSGYRVENGKSYADLTSVRGARRVNAHVLGLTRTEAKVSIHMDATILKEADSGFECAAPQITITLDYVPIVVFIANEFSPRGCAYAEILAHEARHAQAYLDFMHQVEAELRGALIRRAAARPLYAPVGKSARLLEQEIDLGWMPYIREQLAKVELLHAAIDTPEEYERLSTICKGEVQSILGPAPSQLDRFSQPMIKR